MLRCEIILFFLFFCFCAGKQCIVFISTPTKLANHGEDIAKLWLEEPGRWYGNAVHEEGPDGKLRGVSGCVRACGEKSST